MPQAHKPKVLNPKSRKAARKVRQIHQKERINLKHKITDSKQSLKFWFKNQILEDTSKKFYSLNEVQELISKYLTRFESNEHEYDHFISMSVDINRMYVAEELNEYKSSGLMVPDLLSKAGMEQLRNWVTDKEKMQQINLIKIRQPKNTNVE